MQIPIINIKRFAVHDGPDIRTTLHVKGCPLSCIWCHNPESISRCPELGFYAEKCIGCGECIAICPQNAHAQDMVGHRFARERCIACGKCAENCLGEALILYGKEITAREAAEKLLEDRAFFGEKGGVTLSGGESLMYPSFCEELLKILKCEKIHTAIDTCGFVSRNVLDRVLPYTDLFLYDIKAMDSHLHARFTGEGNEKILDNLLYLDIKGAKTEIRIPYVPGYNDGEMEKIALFLKQLINITGIKILPYHKYADAKYAAIDRTNTLPHTVPTDEEIKMAQEIFCAHGLTVL